MWKILVMSFITLLGVTHGFFDEQAKLLSENGNLIIESAVDKNISFRLVGRGSLNINDVNVNRLFHNGTDVTDPLSIGLRLNEMDTAIGNLRRRFNGNRGITTRLNRLENVTRTLSGTVPLNDRMRNVFRRMSQLEGKVQEIVTKLTQDNCDSNPCQNGGSCIDIYDGFMCKCSDAWTGPTCTDDVNECAIFVGTDLGCQNGASCINAAGSYSCQCLPGWQGIHCTRRNVDCLASGSAELCGHGTCVQSNDPIGYRCICDQGWKSNDQTPTCTIDVNECADAKPHCSMEPVVACINIPGSYMCGPCPHGYTGNGHYCSDINECEVNNGGCSVAPLVSCINLRGSYQCSSCPVGYIGDGRTCALSIITRPDGAITTSLCSTGICHPLAQCIEGAFRPVCVCPPGFTGSGYGQGGCVQGIPQPCASNPCQNGGTCTTDAQGTSFSCNCPPGTSRPYCTVSTDPCSRFPCQNGGTCTSLDGNRFRCSCSAKYTGMTCQTEVRACGGVLTGLTGTLKYPPSDDYPHNSRCAWLIRTNVTQVLNVTFTKFGLEASNECRYDWLQIHDGRSSASYMIGRFCGHHLPKEGNIISTNNMLYFWFRSDNSTSHEGFELTWESIDPVCGGIMDVSTYGTISSPGSPGNYPPNRDCTWYLVAPPGKRIQLHFFSMQLETHDTCDYDYLAIYSSTPSTGVMLEKFCNTTQIEPMTTPTNDISLVFHSDATGTDTGFQIHYSVVEGLPGCGGTFTASNGEFGSPMKDGSYPKNLMCDYVIRLPKDSRISITFRTFQLEDASTCMFDYVEIYEGSSIEDPKVGRWCGNHIPPKYESIGNVLLIVFKSDWSAQMEGFRLSYETLCGGEFSAPTGYIASPMYPKQYDHSRTCDYLIAAPIGKAITLDFTDMDMEDNSYPFCNFDYLSIHSGINGNGTVLGRFCGETVPPRVVSSHNYMYMQFQSDSSISGRGFKANYSFTDIGCGAIYRTPGHTISPPMSGSGYKHNAKCTWMIMAPPGHVVQLAFSSFHLEDSNGCYFDSISVYDGYVNETVGADPTKPIGNFCGSTIPPLILSTGNVLSFIFKTDDSASGDGFAATYNFIDGKHICGGKYFSAAGTLRSPNYPQRYPSNKDCTWVITADNGKQVELVVKHFELEGQSNCVFDSLEIRNGGTESSPLLGTYCGVNIPPRIQSFSNQIFLRLRTDSSSELKGFEIDWDSSTTGCGGAFTNAARGSITSPNYPLPYGENAQCDWRISLSPGSTISMIISDLELEEQSECVFDSLEIYDGPDASATSLGKYCSSSHPLYIETSNNHAFIRLRTDISNQGRGFELRFDTNCQKTMTARRGSIESPNFPNAYANNLDCQWTILPQLGNKLYVEFSHFDLEYSGEEEDYAGDSTVNCFDFVTIDEIDAEDKVLNSHKYCNNIPKPIETTRKLVIKFHADYSNGGRGFHLEYETRGCGGELTRAMDHFTSPNYPNNYPIDTMCNWVITAEVGQLIELTFVEFDFEATSSCALDGIVISNDLNQTNVIAKLCSSKHEKPHLMTSSGHKMYVSFYSDFSNAGRGFSATYRTVTAKCGGQFVLPKGSFASPNYPNNFEKNTTCEWLLETEASHTMALQFSDMDLEESVNCSETSVKIYSGSEKLNDKLLLNVCGKKESKTIGFTSPIASINHQMLVVFETKQGYTSKGFSADFQMSCGSRIVTNSSGYFEVGHNTRWIVEDCVWTIIAEDPAQHVTLNILHLDNDVVFQRYVSDVGNNSGDADKSCLRTILIHDGDSRGSPIKESLCSNKHPPAIVSSGNALTLSLANTTEDGFSFSFDIKAHYSVLDNACGGRYNAESGDIASPSYPKSYPNNIECVWQIEATEGNKMSITIEMIDIVPSDSCNNDYLEVRENDGSGKILGIFCNSNVPPTITSSKSLWMKFRSDIDGTGRGFLATYSYVKSTEHNGDTGVITSPRYPNFLYLIEGSYTYRISVDVGFSVQLTFDTIVLKRDSSIIIYDGYDDQNTDTLVTQRTDEISLNSIVSSTNVVYLVFSIASFSESKFKLTWNKVTSGAQSPSNQTFVENRNCTANSVITVHPNQLQRIISPGFPAGYDINQHCMWTFSPADSGYHVVLSFAAIDLEPTTDCVSDYVQISSTRDMMNFNASSRLCEPSPDLPLYHGDPSLRLEFNSDSYLNRSGFAADVELSCGGTLTGPNGRMTGDMFGRPADRLSRSCTWTITVKRGRKIKFEMEGLWLMRRNAEGSCINHILIRDGGSEDSPFLGVGKFCDNHIEIPNTSSNKAYVQYVREGALALTEDIFNLQYKQMEHGCGGEITLSATMNSTEISSPNYPNIPSAYVECIWKVIAPNGELLVVDFIERFDLTSSRNCTDEFVEIRDGSTTAASLVGKFCQDKPSTQYTTSNMARIHYFTDVSVPKNGFKAKISMAKCGGSFTSWSGFISSKNYPGLGAYPSQTVCEYRITGKANTMLNITFLDLHLPPATHNYSDTEYIIITSILGKSNYFSDADVDEVAVVYGTTIPEPIITESNEVVIKFVTKQANSQYRGFRLSFTSTKDECGGEVQAETGVILSPDYPVGRDRHRYCEWTITVPKGRRVRVDIVDFDIRSVLTFFRPLMGRGRRMVTRLGFYYNQFNMAPIRTYQRSVSGTYEPIYSTDNHMMVSLFLADNTGHRGVKLNFSSNEESPCVGELNGLSGTFRTPTNLTTFLCAYERSSLQKFVSDTPNLGTLGIRISDVSVYPRGCEESNINIASVFYTKNTNEVLVPRVCGNRTHNYVATPFVDTKIVVKQFIGSSVEKQLVFDYKVHICGGIFQVGDALNLSLPILSDEYGGLDCAWQFKSDTQKMQLAVTASSLDCDHEYVNVYNGELPTSPKVATICGTPNNSRLFTMMNSMFVEYHTDRYRPLSQFNILITTDDGICGGDLQSPHYYLSSPKNGTNYPNNIECVWNLKARNGFHIGLSFVERFFLESSPNCSKDYIAVYDKLENNTWSQLGRFCGRDVPRVLNSTSTEMRVVLHTDSSQVGDGFAATWTENCGGVFTATRDVKSIESPGYPNRYLNNLNCNYTIISEKDDQININFVDFELESLSMNCEYDNVTIYKASPWTIPAVMEVEGVYCRPEWLGKFRSATKMAVHFRTDRWIVKRGFKFEYSLDNCGGPITQTTRIHSPTGVDNNSLADSKCVWNITAPANMKIVVRFEMIDLERHDSCFMDYVDVFAGHNANAMDNRRARICGNITDHLPVIGIGSNMGMIKYRTDSTISGKGFSATILFMQACDRTIKLNSSNPTYTLDQRSVVYDDMLDCHYEFTAPDGYVVQLDFEQFHVAFCAATTLNSTGNATDLIPAPPPCSCDFVEVRDGAGPFSELMGKYCGFDKPLLHKSSSNSLWMRFATDGSLGSTGFKATLRMVTTACGPSEHNIDEQHPIVELSLPVSGNSYNPNMNCQWRIAVPNFNIVEIKFEKFDIQDDELCSHDYLEILNDDVNPYISTSLGETVIYAGEKSRTSAPYFFTGKQWAMAPHRYCGSSIPRNYYSSSSTIAIRFKSDADVQKGGFKLMAKSSDVCDRNYNATQGRLVSKESRACEAYINAPENHTISLYFTAFNYYLNEVSCAEVNTPIEVIDGKNGAVIKTLCGAEKPNPIFTTTNVVKLKFRQVPVSWIDNNGLYDITFLSTDKGSGCGGEIYNFAGTFASPGYPLNDRNQSDCSWLVTVPTNLRVAIQFEVFDMGANTGCADNYVEIVEQCVKDEPVDTRKFCGSDNPAKHIAKCNQVTVHMKKNSNFSGTGWLINFMAITMNASEDIQY